MALTMDTTLPPTFDHNALSIFKLSEPILSQPESERDSHHDQRASDVSSSTTADNPTPASLEADLAHYKELFTKLRFSYVEQVTKEKFLRTVVGDPPLYVSQSENTALEAQLLGAKEQLKARKVEVAEMVDELEDNSRRLAQRWHTLQARNEHAQNLPSEIEALVKEIEQLRETQVAWEGEGEGMNLPLGTTMERVDEKETEMEALDREIEEMEAENDRKQRQLSGLVDELGPLQRQKEASTTAAKEARKRKDGGGARGSVDELEERGRWLRSVEATMRALFEDTS